MVVRAEKSNYLLGIWKVKFVLFTKVIIENSIFSILFYAVNKSTGISVKSLQIKLNFALILGFLYPASNNWAQFWKLFLSHYLATCGLGRAFTTAVAFLTSHTAGQIPEAVSALVTLCTNHVRKASTLSCLVITGVQKTWVCTITVTNTFWNTNQTKWERAVILKENALFTPDRRQDKKIYFTQLGLHVTHWKKKKTDKYINVSKESKL